MKILKIMFEVLEELYNENMKDIMLLFVFVFIMTSQILPTLDYITVRIIGFFIFLVVLSFVIQTLKSVFFENEHKKSPRTKRR